MVTIQIKTHRRGTCYQIPHTFILSKGKNSGKPLATPGANSFVITAQTETELKKIEWVCYALWQAGYFQSFLAGSVIPFLRISDFRKIIESKAQKIDFASPRIATLAKEFWTVNEQTVNIIKQMKMIRDIKRLILCRFLIEIDRTH